MHLLTLATATALLLVGGCTSGGSSDDAAGGSAGTPGGSPAAPTPSASASKPAGAECDAIWQAGKTLPADYTSCVTDGATGAQDVTKCTDGSSLIVFRDAFYAVTGRKIVAPDVAPLQDTEEFGAAYAACIGE